MSTDRTRAIAFYLPQFHPIPENDAWWGKGFTEWTNVAQARPLFPGHYQPHIPADHGFYDLRVPEVRQAQADLARAYGIFGFCYYHYWFNGTRLLHRPFDEVLASGQPDFPFCLCWANENWTRRWDGAEKELLISQEYGDADDRAHMRWLSVALKDRRYIRIDGKPIFLVYRAAHLPNPLRTTTIWREEARALGVGEIFLGRVESWGDERGNPAALGFDAAIEFQPDVLNLGTRLRRGKRASSLARKLGVAYSAYDFKFIYDDNQIYDYDAMVRGMLKRTPPAYKRFPGVCPSWDNTARRKSNRRILKQSSPRAFEQWLKAVVRGLRPTHPDERLVFINAWNEWAEGNHLEPCLKWKHGYLEAVRRALGSDDDLEGEAGRR